MRREHETFRNKDRWLSARELHMANEDLKRVSRDSNLHPLLKGLRDSIDHPGGNPPIDYLADLGTRMLTPFDHIPAGAIGPKVEYHPSKERELESDSSLFRQNLKYLFGVEGGYTNNKNDKGGATNLGVTQGTYDRYRKKKNLPSKNVVHINQDEAIQIYYEDYWKPLDRYKVSPEWKTVLFDVSVNSGLGTADSLYRKSGGDLGRFFEMRRNQYRQYVQDDPFQEKFLEGWLNRVDELQRFVKDTQSE